MSDKDFNRKARKVREENRLIFAFLAVSLTKNQETRLDFEKALAPTVGLSQSNVRQYGFLFVLRRFGTRGASLLGFSAYNAF